MPLHLDWKSADEIAAAIAAREVALPDVVIDLWKRVDELQKELERLRPSLIRSDPW
jgi:hypothetical protein